MAHMSSPIAYPPSSSPPQVIESRKRSINDLQAYPLKKRPFFGNERPKEPAMGPLGSSLLLKRPIEADKENTSPKNREVHVEDDHSDHPVSRGEKTTAISLKTITKSQQPSTIESPSRGLFATHLETPRSGMLRAQTARGRAFRIRLKEKRVPNSYETLIGERSTHAAGEAKRSFYGVDIHLLLDKAAILPNAAERSSHNLGSEKAQPPTEIPFMGQTARRGRKMLWTEKYRARKFADLVGDDRIHRDVLRWLKGWDSTVFPGSAKPKPIRKFQDDDQEPRIHKKILMLTGPPGLGKTTLAHVCARQAGYEVLEINASDERSRDVVKGRIRDCVGTDNVKGINTKTDDGNVRKTGKPFCLVVDEVDGVVSGSSGGEGGFIKALIDLVMLDQKNSNVLSSASSNSNRSKKGDKFRLLRPVILICNDVYHPALRPLRSTTIAEVVHIRKPPLDKIVTRLGSVFDQEGIPCDKDGVRRLCEATWGLSNRRERSSQSSGSGEGDMRSILVVAEWVASKLSQTRETSSRLTKKWLEENMLDNLSHGGGAARGMGRGGTREAVERVFQDQAGFATSELLATSPASEPSPQSSDAQGVSQAAKRSAMQRLQEILEASGESDRIIMDCFAAYPSHQFQDDTFLSKPNAAYDWLHFYDRLSSKVHSGQEWELGPYLSQPALGLHHLFASPAKQFGGGDQQRWNKDAEEGPILFLGPKADYEASETTKQNKATLLGFQSSLSTPLLRSFRSAADISTDLLPNIIKMLTPDVKPIIVGGSGDQRGVVSVRKEGERAMIQRAVRVMSAVGVNFERSRVDDAGQAGVSTYIYRMEPPLDSLATYETASQQGPAAPTRYAIRQALDQEYQKFVIQQNNDARQARYKAGKALEGVEPDEVNDGAASQKDLNGEDGVVVVAGKTKPATVERDFFGRIVVEAAPRARAVADGSRRQMSKSEMEAEYRKVWVSFHEGFSNAVRKPITLDELLRSF